MDISLYRFPAGVVRGSVQSVNINHSYIYDTILVIWHSDDALKSTYCDYWTGDDVDDYQVYEQLSFFLIPWVVDAPHHQLKSKNRSATPLPFTPGSCFKVVFLKVAVKQQQNILAMAFVVIACYRSGII